MSSKLEVCEKVIFKKQNCKEKKWKIKLTISTREQGRENGKNDKNDLQQLKKLEIELRKSRTKYRTQKEETEKMREEESTSDA